MFATERIRKIKRMLIEYKKVDVSNLSNLLSVSEVTIRKDLERLESDGFIQRIHGGAILCDDGKSENVYESHTDIPEIEHKKMIGLIAAQIVNNNEAIFIGPGTTCLHVAKNLKEKRNLNIITNNVSAAIELSNIPDIKVVLTGGDIKQQEYTYSLTGSAVIQALKNIYVDRAFIGVNGISFKRGYTLHDSDDSMIASEICKNANEFIVVADNTKFNKISFSQLGNLNMAKKVISDELVPEDYIKFYFENNVQIFTTYKLEY